MFLEGKILDFRLARVFCRGYCLSKHKIKCYSKNLGTHGLLDPSLVTPMIASLRMLPSIYRQRLLFIVSHPDVFPVNITTQSKLQTWCDIHWSSPFSRRV